MLLRSSDFSSPAYQSPIDDVLAHVVVNVAAARITGRCVQGSSEDISGPTCDVDVDPFLLEEVVLMM